MNIRQKLSLVRSSTKLPIAAGFGISNRSQMESLSGACDGIVVGSAIMELVLNPKNRGIIPCLGEFLDSLLL
ncbi:MAG: tryptophan synthase subunit alpha [Desulfatiglandales bacterium]